MRCRFVFHWTTDVNIWYYCLSFATYFGFDRTLAWKIVDVVSWGHGQRRCIHLAICVRLDVFTFGLCTVPVEHGYAVKRIKSCVLRNVRRSVESPYTQYNNKSVSDSGPCPWFVCRKPKFTKGRSLNYHKRNIMIYRTRGMHFAAAVFGCPNSYRARLTWGVLGA